MNTSKQNTKVYKEHGYNYVVVLTEKREYVSGGVIRIEFDKFFKNRKTAENFNERELKGFGEVLTINQACKYYPEWYC